MRKNIDEYWDTYKEIYGFEEVLRVYRERKALEYLRNQGARKILEIGCGFRPLFLNYEDYDSYTVVEPGAEAYKYILEVSEKKRGVRSIFGHLEDVMESLNDNDFDCIVLVGVLHEVKHPEKFLGLIHQIMRQESSAYINVPNARSVHRELGKAMGVIDSIYNKTQRNELLNQESIFDLDSLFECIQQSMPNIQIIDSGTFFIKPFTHDQMYEILKSEVISQSTIEGLFQLSETLPGHGCELFYVIKNKDV